jgi:uncharacterized membrane protein
VGESVSLAAGMAQGLRGWGRSALVLIIVTLTVWLGRPAQAHAAYDLCNSTSYTIRAAVAFKVAGDYQSAGWFTVYPGFCRPIIDKPLNQETYYIHARTVRGHKGPMRAWTGDDEFCVDQDDFDIKGDRDCEKRGYASAYFAEVDVGHAKSWTTTFTEPTNYSLKRAQVFGVQRLLYDLGYLRKNQMDGYLGGSTAHAINKFERARSLHLGDEPSIKLLRALAKAADANAKGRGLQICNQTNYAIWAAIGIPQRGSQVNTKGWYRLKPQRCMTPVVEALSDDFVYVYGETVDDAAKKLYWHGDTRLCTNDVRFSITAKPDSCQDSGFVPAGFAKVDTDGKPFWRYTFTDDKATPRSGS